MVASEALTVAECQRRKGHGKESVKRRAEVRSRLPSPRCWPAATSFWRAGFTTSRPRPRSSAIAVDSKDWAVLFSTKDGKDKLSVCLDPKQHGGIGSSQAITAL